MTAREKIREWFRTPGSNATSLCVSITYKEIGELLGLSPSSVSINLPLVVVELFKHEKITIKQFKDRRREVARELNRRGLKIPEATQKKLKKLRRRQATYLECAAELGLHYQTIRKYCQLLNC